jgi:hypothetical protein
MLFQGPPSQKGSRGDIGLSILNGEMGIKGAKGQKGEPGSEGPQGLPGRHGPVGEKGSVGPKGAPGLAGLNGLSVSQGINNHFCCGHFLTISLMGCVKTGGAITRYWFSENCMQSPVMS